MNILLYILAPMLLLGLGVNAIDFEIEENKIFSDSNNIVEYDAGLEITYQQILADNGYVEITKL